MTLVLYMGELKRKFTTLIGRIDPDGLIMKLDSPDGKSQIQLQFTRPELLILKESVDKLLEKKNERK